MPRVSRVRRLSVAVTLLVSISTSVFAETPARTVAATVKKPMLFVARLVTQEKLRPNIDEILQDAPSAKALGAKWTVSNPAWEKARSVITKRIDRIADHYGDSDAYAAMLQSETTVRRRERNPRRSRRCWPARRGHRSSDRRR